MTGQNYVGVGGIKLTLLLIVFGVYTTGLNAQTVHVGGNFSWMANYLLNKTVKFNGDDSTYRHSAGTGGGLSAAIYFHRGGYYHKRIFGIKTELNFAKHNQRYKVYPGPGAAKTDSFYTFKTSLSYTDVPVLFTFCPNHHQGFVFELGPQISFLRKAAISSGEFQPGTSNYQKDIPKIDLGNYNKVMYSAVLGLGLFYNVSEKIALAGLFRFAAGLSDVTKNNPSVRNYSSTTRISWGLNLQAYYKFNSYFAKKNKGL